MSRTTAPSTSTRDVGLSRYVDDIKRVPLLDADEEFQLARRWREHGERAAADRLVNSHLRLVVKLAANYRGYGLPVAELIGEVERTELVHLEGDTLIPLEPKYGIHIPQVFTGDDGSGRSLYIHSGRALRRAD